MGALDHEHGVAFRVWAPNAESVHVTGDFNDWDDEATPLEREGGGYWYGDVAGATAGQGYKFVIGARGERFARIDPYARAVTSSVGNGIIVSRAHEKHDFEMPPWNRLVMYEMHVGTFHRTQDNEVGTFEDAIRRLDHLKKLGVSAVQVMPAMEFAGDVSLGYNPAHIFAIESSYGGPEAFRNFIRAAHEAGIAVILDVVYNHFGPSDLDLWRFDGWGESDKGGIYFYNDWRSNTPWGDTRPDYGRPEVRQFIRDNALFWLDEYGLDGLRFDMTLYMRTVKGDENDPEDALEDGWSLMRWINEEVRDRFPGRIIIAEDLRNQDILTAAPADGGAGFGAQWDAEFVHPIRAVLVAQDDARRDMGMVARALSHAYNGDPYQRVVYTESHDEVANGKARVVHEIAPGDPSHWAAQKRSTLGAALTLTAPGIPMLFQGQEFLQGEWFQDTVPLDWDRSEEFHGIIRLYRDLIRFRLDRMGVTAGLGGRHIALTRIDEDQKVVAYRRWHEGGPGDDVMIVANFSHEPKRPYRVGFPEAGHWVLRLNSDWKGYSDDFANFESADVTAEAEPLDDLPASAGVAIGSYSLLIYSKDPQRE
ncbi:MAG: alpha-amylase family glycosyl hydrolase [Tistlia sp.]|uniref:alpha-amylase family glycosyl hydrolase n=1 Tax=Tistlia sp. TaxID=3057121 RepID=UPI0034A4536D